MSATVQTDAELPIDLIERVQSLSRPARQKLGDLMLKMDEALADDPEVVRHETNALIKDRLEGFLSGKYAAEDWRESLDRVRAQLRAEFPQ